VTTKAYSVFGQLRYKITPELELAGGLRWTDEKKNAVITNVATSKVVPIAVPHIHSDNVAPEATLTYRPSDDMTLFASFKQAYLSGGFSQGPLPPVGSDISFGDEKAQGGEAGVKSRWLDRQLRVDLSVYYYNYTGLQVGSSIGLPSGQVVTTIVNAAAARSYGLDLDAVYHPQTIAGLTLNGGANWNRARFLTLKNAPCYGGQTIALGCNQVFNAATGLFTAQDVSGTQILRAPEWQFTLGFDYELPVTGDYKLILSNITSYSSSYPGVLDINRPNNDNYQSAYAQVDLGLTLRAPDDRWEIAMLGKNITDKIISGTFSQANAACSLFCPSISGGTVSGPAGVDEMITYAHPGREIWLRVTWRP